MDFTVSRSCALDETISDTAIPAPIALHNWRNGRSVTPAMGATIRLFLRACGPICISAPREKIWTAILAQRMRDGSRLCRLTQSAKYHALHERAFAGRYQVEQRQGRAARSPQRQNIIGENLNQRMG